MTRTVLIYHTEGCHLCSEAMRLAEPVAELYGCQLIPVDIVDDPDLLETYATTIPVISDSMGDEKLFWPFATQDLIAFFEGLSV